MKRYFAVIISIMLIVQIFIMPSFSIQAYAVDLESIKSQATDASNSVKEGVGHISDAAQDAANEVGEKADEFTDKAKDNISKAKENVSDAAGKAYTSASEAASKAKEKVVGYIANIDTEKYKAGWDYVSNYTGTTIAALKGQNYVNSVQSQITKTSQLMQSELRDKVNTARSISSDAGFAAEIWHTDTFNLEAALDGSDYSANRPDSNGKASADVVITNDKGYSQDYSLKYYKDANSSAKAQAKTFYEDYRQQVAEDTRHGKRPPSAEEYLDKYDKSMDDLYDSLYAGQGKIIPADQLDDAKEYLKQKKIKADVSDSIERQKFSPELQESLDTLAARIEAPDGTKSAPLTEAQAKQLVELTRDNKDLDLADFGVKPSQLITTKYILKQALDAGKQSAIVSAAFAIGPDVYTIIVDAAKEGKIDEKKLKETGIEGILAGSEGFVEGSVSSAIVVACQSGKFGAAYTDIAPETVGTITVLTIDAIRYGYKLSQGEINETEYADLMAEDIIIAIASQSTGALCQALFPFIPFAYLAGSMAGAMIASVGYTAGKDIILQVRGENGFETVVPETIASGKSLVNSFMNDFSLTECTSEFQNMTVDAIGKGKIKVMSIAKK